MDAALPKEQQALADELCDPAFSTYCSLHTANGVIHEVGYAINGQKENDSDVSAFDRSGPNWMKEAYAILNEFLLDDYLYRQASDTQGKVYFLKALLNEISFQLFTSAEEGELEQSIYDGVAAGRTKNVADLDALTMSVWKKYEIDPEPQYAHSWMTKSLMFQDPLYLVNYLYAGLLATKMFDMAQHDPHDFQRRYTALLRRGFDAPPEVLLRDFFGHDVSARDLVDDDMKILRERTKVLAQLYRQLEARK